MADVFLSYAHKDADIAEKLAQAIRTEGLSVWFDGDLHGGAEFASQIEAEITGATKVVALWTKNSITSRWVKDEASIALEQSKLVPVATGGTLSPIGFRQIQTVDLDAFASGKDQELPEPLRMALGLGRGSEQGPSSRPSIAQRFPLWAQGLFAIFLIVAAILAITNLSGGGVEDGNGGVSLVVMPLEANGGNPEEIALARGITDELIVRMRRIPELSISSGTANSNLTPPEGSFVLRGTLRRDDDQLRVSQVLEDSGGQILWSQNFDREVTDLFYVQEEIARSVAGAMSASLDVGVESRSYGGTDNSEAYALYIQGRAARHNPDRSIPISLLERAVSLDPDYAKALTELSYAYGISMYFAREEAEIGALKKGMDEMSRRAAELAPDLWIGHAARGWYHLQNREFVAADKAHRRVAELDPGNDPEVLQTLSNFQVQLGRTENARELRRAKALIDPAYREEARILGLEAAGKVVELISALEEAVESGQGLEHFNFPEVYWLGMTNGYRDRVIALAKTLDRSSIAANPAFGPALPNLPLPQLRAHAEKRFGAGGRADLAGAALFASYLGDQDLALDYLRLAYQERDAIGAFGMIWSPALSGLRETPEFAQWIEELGMADSWRESGDWGDYCRPLDTGRIACR